MIPPFDESGYLPPGIHTATAEEVGQRFGHSSELRRVQMESIRWMIELARDSGAERIILNGSFVTDIIEPNDVDCTILVKPRNRRNRRAIAKLRKGLPFLDLAMVRQEAFDEYVYEVFSADRMGQPKGMIEVIAWS
jgi:hypothetical protein